MVLAEVRLTYWKAFPGQLLCLQCLLVHCGVTADGFLHISSRPWAVFLIRIVICCCESEARCSRCISTIWQLRECSTLGSSFSLPLHTAAWAGGDLYLSACLSMLFPHHIPQLWKVTDFCVLPRPDMSWMVKPTKFEGMAYSFLFLHAFWTYFLMSLIISMALLVVRALPRSCWLSSHFQFLHQACYMFFLNSKLECGGHPPWSISQW